MLSATEEGAEMCFSFLMIAAIIALAFEEWRLVFPWQLRQTFFYVLSLTTGSSCLQWIFFCGLQ